MKRKLLIFLVLLLLSPAVFAHRLNEYLQATTISLSHGRLWLDIRLTPGTDVAARVLEEMDRNADHHVSAAEQQRYLAAFGRDLSLTLDGNPIPLQQVSGSFPGTEAMKNGTGDILIRYQAGFNAGGARHQLTFSNRHYAGIAVYLVNCLLPADTGIRVLSQTRSADQSDYRLDFTIGGEGPVKQVNAQQALQRENRQAVIRTYFGHGVRHILTGYDHLLFLCALVLGAAGLWDLIKLVTAFTLAHSITLTLATFGYAHLPEVIVEPLIAASIVFVAVQNIWWPLQAGGYCRLAIAFFFGLFHGLGFAGGLLQLMHAMPAGVAVFALIGFSLGVEAGNQLVLLPLYGLLQLLRHTRSKAVRHQPLVTFRQYASGAVALAGLGYLCADLWTFL